MATSNIYTESSNSNELFIGDTSGQTLYERSEKAFQEVVQWQGLWQTVLHFVAPNSNSFYRASGTRKQVNVYDNTPMYFANMFIAQFISNIFPPRSRFATLTPSHGMVRRYLEQNQISVDSESDFESAREILSIGCEKLSAQIYDLILDSNFDMVLPRLVLNYMISCGAAHVSHDHYRGHGISFQVPTLGTFAFDTDAFGNIYGVYYASAMSLQNAQLQWDLVNLPENVQPKTTVQLIECVVKDRIKTKNGRLKNVWKYVVLMSPGKGARNKGAANEVTVPVYFDSCPWSFMRAESVRSEVWGRGRLVEVLQDIMRINNTTRNRVISEDIAASPMFLYKDDGSINSSNIRFQPGAMLKVRDTGSKNGASIVPLTMPYNLALNENVRQNNNAAIQKLLVGDPMLMQDRNSYQTATEYTSRQHQNQMMWSKDYGKIVAFAKNILLSVCDLGLSSGEIVLPAELALFEGSYDLDYFGVKLEAPISKMYNMQEVESLVSAVQIIGSIDPQLLSNGFDLAKIPDWIAEKLGIDHEILRTQEEKEALQMQAQDMATKMSGVANLLELNSSETM